MQTIESRLATLERTVLFYRRGAALLGALVIVGLATAFTQQDTPTNVGVSDFVRTHRIEVLDVLGNAVAVLEARGSPESRAAGWLEVRSGSGNPAITAKVNAD